MACFASDFFPLETLLAGFEACFGFGRALFFHRDSIDLSLLNAEILHQRNIARANPGAGTAFDTVGQVVRFGFIVDLALAEPVELLGQQIGRTGIGTGTASDTAFLFRLVAHFTGRRCQQAVGDLHHRYIQPRQGEAHQWPAHDHHLFAARTEISLIQQMADRGAQPCPDVTRTVNSFTGQGDHTLGKRFAVDNGTFNRIGGPDVLHQHADIRGATAVRNLFAG